jgi:hypothetical protein
MCIYGREVVRVAVLLKFVERQFEVPIGVLNIIR